MGHKLHNLLGALKDKASLAKATLSSSSSSSTATTSTTLSPSLAVLRATAHHPSSSPPSPLAVSSLLAFGRSSRLSAAALLRSFSSRLASTSDPSVALKSLLCLHHLLSRGSFILLDAISSSLSPSSGRRSPLHLSSFNSPSSLLLSSWVRWYARFLELLVTARALQAQAKDEREEQDLLTSLLNTQLIAGIEPLVAVMEEIGRAPAEEASNMLVAEVGRMVEEERVRAEAGVLARVREVRERVGELGFGDCVELAWLVKRAEECGIRKRWSAFWSEVREVGERVGEVVERKESEEREKRRRVSRERVLGESARMMVADTVVAGGDGGEVRLGSSARWSTR